MGGNCPQKMLLSCELVMILLFCVVDPWSGLRLVLYMGGRFCVNDWALDGISLDQFQLCLDSTSEPLHIYGLVDVLSRPAFLQWVIDCVPRALYHFPLFCHLVFISFCINFTV